MTDHALDVYEYVAVPSDRPATPRRQVPPDQPCQPRAATLHGHRVTPYQPDMNLTSILHCRASDLHRSHTFRCNGAAPAPPPRSRSPCLYSPNSSLSRLGDKPYLDPESLHRW